MAALSYAILSHIAVFQATAAIQIQPCFSSFSKHSLQLQLSICCQQHLSRKAIIHSASFIHSLNYFIQVQYTCILLSQQSFAILIAFGNSSCSTANMLHSGARVEEESTALFRCMPCLEQGITAPICLKIRHNLYMPVAKAQPLKPCSMEQALQSRAL